MNTDRKIGKLKDRLGWIKEDGFAGEAENAAKQQHMKTPYTLTIKQRKAKAEY